MKELHKEKVLVLPRDIKNIETNRKAYHSRTGDNIVKLSSPYMNPQTYCGPNKNIISFFFKHEN